MTDRSERFIAAEIIREKITLLTHQEIPYATAVVVDAFKEDEAKNMIRIAATIHVAKDSQKGIIIGKKGAMLKEIGTRARLEMEKFFAAKVFLELVRPCRKGLDQRSPDDPGVRLPGQGMKLRRRDIPRRDCLQEDLAQNHRDNPALTGEVRLVSVFSEPLRRIFRPAPPGLSGRVPAGGTASG